jgi:molecular chaperone DnaK (HSP70)
MGASFTQATLVSYYTIIEANKAKNKTIEYNFIKIIDETWDENLGGNNFDYAIVRKLLNLYNSKYGDNMKKIISIN